jgi:pyruvate/2-oxoglutarate dehydrogenase complex dihydrolipoamide dehydrogenase (E3) component
MSTGDSNEVLVIGGGDAGKHLTSTTTSEDRQTAVVERKLIGG